MSPLDWPGPGPVAGHHRSPDTVITAARVAWLPPERDGERRVRWADVLSQVNPRRPPALWQELIIRRQPGRAQLVVAEPATVAALRERWGGAGSFAQFVSRQARLALDRAERAQLGYRYKVPKDVAEAIEDTPAFRADVAALAARLGLTEQETAERARADLDGLVASMSPVAVDLLSGALRPLHAYAWDIQSDTAGLDRLRELNRRYALVFLPSHRSYADPLLLADVLAAHDFPRNHMVGGDNLRIWPLSVLARRAGFVFIRRSIGDDEVYKLALREYLGYLLAKRFNLEWYMEGGRSRTGKLRPPRYGLLAYVADAIARGRAARRLPGAGGDHLRPAPRGVGDGRRAGRRGQEARRARLARVLRPGAAHQDRHGTHLLRRAAVGARRPRPSRRGDPDAQRLAVQKMAFEVAVRINRVTPVTATALVTLALLGVRDRALTLGSGPRRARAAPLFSGRTRGCRTRTTPCGADAGVRRCSTRWPSRPWSPSTPAGRSRCTRSSGASTWSPRSTATAPFTTSCSGRWRSSFC